MTDVHGTLGDEEVLPVVLRAAAGARPDVASTARRLRERYGSFSAAVTAPIADLRQIDGVGAVGADLLKAVHTAAIRLARAEIADRPILGNWHALIDYLTIRLAREPVEEFRVLYLNAKNRLLSDEAHSRGTVNHTAVYPREVVRRALEVGATAMIVVHNHPSGDPAPSAEDIDMTRRLRHAAEIMGIAVHDHIVVGNGRHVSMRQTGLM